MGCKCVPKSEIRKPNSMKKTILTIFAAVLACMPAAYAQVTDQHGHAVDTTAIYGERADSLEHKPQAYMSRQLQIL